MYKNILCAVDLIAIDANGNDSNSDCFLVKTALYIMKNSKIIALTALFI
tara:strand:- start:169 stop:315 length:147 start_codon:yes stop_codon:yes gene_type:complete